MGVGEGDFPFDHNKTDSGSISIPACPTCTSTHTVKNGRIHNGKQRFKCRDYGRQFVEHPHQKGD
ncbi:IS1 family transposase [Limnospira fusiformis]|uniref:IS1 family transposase n=1 Tax=Limnospira TaxID=2596745 RepID=UPI001658A742